MDHYHPDLGVVAAGQSFTLGAGAGAIRFPGNWLDLASAEERAARGFLPVADTPPPDGRLYTDIVRADPAVIDGVAVLPWTATPRPLAEAQAALVATTKEEVRARIKATGHDDYALRKISTGADIPADVLATAEAIRAVGNAYEAAVLACGAFVDLVALAPPDWPQI